MAAACVPPVVVAAMLRDAPFGAQDLLARWRAPRTKLDNSVATAVRDVPSLDGDGDGPFARMKFGDLRALPRRDDGAFALKPGAWEMTAETFCLYPGKSGPQGGDGYLFSPTLKGPKAELVTKVLERAWKFPEIPQEDIQSLLWSILSDARYSLLAVGPRQAAEQLLTPAELVALDTDAGDRFTRTAMEKARERLPASVARLLEVEARLRNALTTGASYAEQARLAVPNRAPEPETGDRDVPAGRWSIAGGYLVRFMPKTYTSTKIQVVLPEPTTVTYDGRRRITSMRSPDGWAVEAEYDDTIPPLSIRGERDLKGWAFKRVTCRQPVGGVIKSLTLNNVGWTFAGRFTGNGQIGTAPEPTAVWFGGPAADMPPQGDSVERYVGWHDRYQDGKKGFERSKAPTGDDIGNLTDRQHYGNGVKAALGGDPTEKADWLDDHFDRLGRAFGYVSCRLSGGCDPDAPTQYKPGGAATPARNGSQLLGISGR